MDKIEEINNKRKSWWYILISNKKKKIGYYNLKSFKFIARYLGICLFLDTKTRSLYTSWKRSYSFMGWTYIIIDNGNRVILNGIKEEVCIIYNIRW